MQLTSISHLATGLALGAEAGFLLCGLIIGLGVVDAPTEARKIQKHPVPTSGGLGFGAATFLAIACVMFLRGGGPAPALAALGAGAAGALVLGFVDDLFRLPARAKLLAMIGIVLSTCAAGVRAEQLVPWTGVELTLPIWLAAAGSAVWLLLVINAVNFMDGANGLAMGMAAIAALGLALCAALAGEPDLALAGLALAGGLIGFLPWNIPGRLFAGDAGALFVGAALGGLSLLLVSARPDFLFVPPVILMPFLADVLLTLAWRARRGKRLFEAHRDHAYQIAMKAGLGHGQVALFHAIWAFNAAAMGVAAALVGGRAPVLVFVVLAAASVWLHLKVRRMGVRAGLVGAAIP